MTCEQVFQDKRVPFSFACCRIGHSHLKATVLTDTSPSRVRDLNIGECERERLPGKMNTWIGHEDQSA